MQQARYGERRRTMRAIDAKIILYCQDGSAASVQVDMQIEAAARLKSTFSDLPALEISRSISFGAPPPIFAPPL